MHGDESDASNLPDPADVFNDALDLPGDRRRAYVEARCAGHRELIAETLALLGIAEEHPALLEPRPSPPRELGSCRLVRICGRGAMGVVYEAINLELDRRVALKILPDHLAADPRAIERFQQEAKVLGSLGHPGIAVIHRLQFAEGIHFFTMEFVEGRTLAEVIADGPPALATTVDLFVQFADALDHAHRRGIVHRDLKPANLMVTPEGRLKILDFGIARALDVAEGGVASVAGTGRGFSTLRGTPEYMSPEQILGLDVDHRTDVWSFGCLLYECLTGRCATRDHRDPATTLRDEADRPGLAFPRNVPDPLRRLVASCLQTVRDRRPNAVSELLPLLRASVRRRPDRRSVLAVLVPVIAILITAAGVLAWRNAAPIVAIQALDNRALRGVDVRGRGRWVLRLPEEIFGLSDLESLQISRSAVVEQGVPLGAIILTGTIGPGEATSLRYVDVQKGRVQWTRKADWQTPVSARARPDYRWCFIQPWPGEPGHIVIAGITDGVWYSSMIRVLSLDGRLLGEYYHPGRMKFYDLRDFDGDGRPSMLAYGDNSSARFDRRIVPLETDNHCGAVALLDPLDLSGQAFPYAEGQPEPRDWPGMPHAHEEGYLLIPPLGPDVRGQVQGVYIGGTPDSLLIDVGCADGRIFTVGPDLHPLECQIGTAEPAAIFLKDGPDSLSTFWLHTGRMEEVRVPLRR